MSSIQLTNILQHHLLQIQLASGLGDSSKPRSWSKYAADSSAYKNETEKKKDEGKSQKNLSRKEQKVCK